ncbi:DUF4115 domain-containing protein [Aestuariibacter sp. AA17]|uniref:DUF4115 domain-containing protein n=1 Tax=Fluctibacter corallii TaxID=2984329 RepID=A0ABT3A3C1_9ALTE|nr:RodZ domain-containing protein [Aestuariibacter sp. AA17]MCV2883129.1 DUF4115 domain-containing protein [Aestuariibacter sp. AA17]
MSEEHEKVQEPEEVSPGKMLREARERAGLSKQDIAERLHLKEVSIGRLEQDDYDPSISLTFTKGYLRLYAKHVGVSEEAVLQAFDNVASNSKEPAKLQSFSRRVAKQANDDRLMLVTYLVGIIVIALVVMWWWQNTSSSVSSTTTELSESLTDGADSDRQQNVDAQLMSRGMIVDEPPSDAEANAQLHSVTETDSQVNNFVVPQEKTNLSSQAGLPTNASSEAVQEEAFSLSEEPIAPTSDVQNNDAASSINTERNTQSEMALSQQELATPDVENVELVFEFSGDCWMNLVDATGEAIAYGIKAEGRIMPITGVPPFDVTLGAPEVVKIRYNGVQVDMSEFKAGRTARFTLPFSE